jgi:acetyl esterase/lipase
MRSSIGGRISPARGIALFAISYRLANPDQKTFPQAVHDVLAGVQFVRGKAGEFGIDPERIGLLGASAGGHLARRSPRWGAMPRFSPMAIRRMRTRR